jgi:hypothetical protein
MLRISLAMYSAAALVVLGYGLQYYPPFTHPEGFDVPTLVGGLAFYGVLIIVHGFFLYRAGQMSPNRL